MQIKALRGVAGDYGNVRRGQIIDVADAKAQQLVKRGLFVPVQGGANNKGAAKTATSRPSTGGVKFPTGGRTGKGKPSSSSPAGQASKTSRSTKSKDAAE